MSASSIIRRGWWRWILIFSCWTLLGLFSASQIYIRYAYYSDHPPSWRQALIIAFSDWYAWGIVSPLLLWLNHRVPITRNMKKRHLLVHLLAAVICSTLKTVIELQAFRIMTGATRAFTITQLQSNFLAYLAIAGFICAINFYSKYREHELKASQLEARLVQAQLQALKMQLHPHFLFNTLHAVSTLIHKDPEAADRMLARLSDLLRLTLENAGVQEVALKQELEYLERYLAIEQIRFQDRLTVRMEIDPETLDLFVPNFILQPLVENAVRHGIASRSSPGRIEIFARRDHGELQLQVRDDGAGLRKDQLVSRNHGIGLTNTRARLQQLYGPAHRFEMCNTHEGGVVVTLTIPSQPAGQKMDNHLARRQNENSNAHRG
ncbi:MAG: sensor histidine kinase [bacterium]